MTSSATFLPTFDVNSRLLVFAPHPDDETLATGELILAARDAGATVRVVFATDGDNNPWPQRWIEKRWRIDAHARAKWGARRRVEATRALVVLGVDQDELRFLGWPDQGLTDCLMNNEMAERTLAEEISAFSPTQVALPALADRHPDHGALGMLVNLALRRGDIDCTHLEYVVHGSSAGATALECSRDRKERKLRALDEHASQLVLSGKRLQRIAARDECFTVLPAHSRSQALPIVSGELSLHLPLAKERGLRRHELLVLLLHGYDVIRWRIALPRENATLESKRPTGSGRDAIIRIENRHGFAHVSIRNLPADVTGGYLKVERCWPRLVVFDAIGWQDAHAVLANDQTAESNGRVSLASSGRTE